MLPNSAALVTFLINASWQVALVAAVAALCARLMRGGRARDEHRLWAVSLVVAVMRLAVEPPKLQPLPAAASRSTEAGK